MYQSRYDEGLQALLTLERHESPGREQAPESDTDDVGDMQPENGNPDYLRTFGPIEEGHIKQEQSRVLTEVMPDKSKRPQRVLLRLPRNMTELLARKTKPQTPEWYLE